MNIPPPKQRQPFSLEILDSSDELFIDNDLDQVQLISDVDDKWINQIRLQFNENSQEGSIKKSDEEDQSQIQEKINEYKDTIQSLTSQNKELCDLDFNNMSLDEINSEIEKTKKNIIYDESEIEDFQANQEKFQGKIERGHNRISDYRRRIVAFYNEICAWSDPLLKTKFGENEKNPEIDIFDLESMKNEIHEYVNHLTELKPIKKK